MSCKILNREGSLAPSRYFSLVMIGPFIFHFMWFLVFFYFAVFTLACRFALLENGPFWCMGHRSGIIQTFPYLFNTLQNSICSIVGWCRMERNVQWGHFVWFLESAEHKKCMKSNTVKKDKHYPHAYVQEIIPG